MRKCLSACLIRLLNGVFFNCLAKPSNFFLRKSFEENELRLDFESFIAIHFLRSHACVASLF